MLLNYIIFSTQVVPKASTQAANQEDLSLGKIMASKYYGSMGVVFGIYKSIFTKR